MPAAPIYLDHNSTTPIDPRVVEAMVRAWTDCGANPASQHGPGRAARRMLEEAREGIAELLGAKTGGMDADRVIFTSGGTEANNQAVRGLLPMSLAGTKPGPGMGLFSSAIEHPSVASLSEFKRLPVDPAGVAIIPADFDAKLVSLMLASNETGVIQPVAELARVCRERGITVHTDAVQAIGKIPVHFRNLGVDALTLAPHKFHGPLGIGALVIKHGVKIQPQLYGGFQQEGLRPGTENVALAVGFHKALEVAVRELPERAARMENLRNQLERALLESFPVSQEMVVIGATTLSPALSQRETEKPPRLPNTSCIAFPGLDRQALVMALDLAGVACSTGSACASGSSEPSPTLVAMGLPKEVIEGAIRLSLGAFTTPEEVAEAARRILKTVKHLRSQNSG
jgi:cysteine desulfurase